ncbi:ankyrin repeat protein [Mollivirus sibericum]|uniref:ankyrin repeat protein n=1 Tax=Mollivirus sibericum TaxID=1678078 RepID=UPI0006B2EB2A|nr:ankyrin repeat protein [Mollivirus sibericum]ALD61953.1 ankyrin repeat protein [Mollivirus sibericum]
MELPPNRVTEPRPSSANNDAVDAKRKALFDLLYERDPGVIDETRDREIMERFKILVSELADLTSIDEPNRSGDTLLKKAISRGYYDGARFLVEYGADPFANNALLDAFSHLVTWYGEGGLFLRWLLDYIWLDEELRVELPFFFARYDILIWDCLPFMDHDEQRAPLAPLGAGLPLATILAIKYGADVSAGVRGTTETPLHFAIRKGATRVVSALLKAGAQNDSTDEQGSATLHVAEANINALVGADETLLHLAARKGEPQVVSMLLEAGAQIDSIDDRGFTALHVAAVEGRIDVVEVLLDAGANPLLLARDRKDGVSVVSAEFLARAAGHHETARRIAAWIKWSTPSRDYPVPS